MWITGRDIVKARLHCGGVFFFRGGGRKDICRFMTPTPPRKMRNRLAGGTKALQKLVECFCADAQRARKPDAVDQFFIWQRCHEYRQDFLLPPMRGSSPFSRRCRFAPCLIHPKTPKAAKAIA